MRILRSLSSRILFCAFLIASTNIYAQHQTYYVDGGQGQIQSAQGDPAQVKAEEWHVRLYKLGAPTGGRDNWGLITGKSADAVMQKLKDSQDFQKRYARWSGFDYSREVLTFFNPLGPIAVAKPPKPTTNRILAQLDNGIETINRLREGYKKIEQILSGKPQTDNPYRNVGNVLREYTKNLSDAERRLAELQSKLRAEYNYTGELESGLQEFSNSLSKSETSYGVVKTEIDRSMARSSGGNWMTDEFTYTTTDSKGNVFEEIQKYDISATGGILRIKQETTTKESIGLVFGQRQTFPGWRAITTRVVPLSVLNANSIKLDEMTTAPSWRVQVSIKEQAETRIKTESYIVSVEGQTPNESATEQTLDLWFNSQSIAQQAANDLRKLISGGSPASPSARSNGRAASAESPQRAPENAKQNQTNNQPSTLQRGIENRPTNPPRQDTTVVVQGATGVTSNAVAVSQPNVAAKVVVDDLIKQSDDYLAQGLKNKAAETYTKAFEMRPSEISLGLKAARMWLELGGALESRRLLQIMHGFKGIKLFLSFPPPGPEVASFSELVCKHTAEKTEKIEISNADQLEFQKLADESSAAANKARLALIESGRSSLREGKYDPAKEIFNKLLDYTKSGYYHLYLADIYWRQKELEKSQTELRKYFADAASPNGTVNKEFDIATAFPAAIEAAPLRDVIVDALGRASAENLTSLTSPEGRLKQIIQYFENWPTPSDLTSYLLPTDNDTKTNRRAFAVKTSQNSVLTQVITVTPCELQIEYRLNGEKRNANTVAYGEINAYTIGEDHPVPTHMVSVSKELGIDLIPISGKIGIFLPKVPLANEPFRRNFEINVYLQSEQCSAGLGLVPH